MSLPNHIRVRCADEHPLIFRRPEAQPKVARRFMLVATGLGWSVWLYLWRPLVTLFLWYWGAEIAERQWIELAGWNGLIGFAAHVVPYGLALCAILLVWALVNYLRFRGRERRKARPLSSVEADAEWTRVTPAALAEGRRAKNLVCWYDDDGVLAGVAPRSAESRCQSFPAASAQIALPSRSYCNELSPQ